MRYMAYRENKTHGTPGFTMQEYSIYEQETILHWHHEHEIVFVHKGNLSVSLDGADIRLSEGDALYVTDGIIHGYVPEDSLYTCVVFDFEQIVRPRIGLSQKYSDLFTDGKMIQSFFAASSDAAKIIEKLCLTMIEKKRGYEFYAIALTLELFGCIVENELYHVPSEAELLSRKKVLQMKSVLKRIHNDYAEPLTLAELASEAAMAPEYFCRTFKAVIGRSPIDYLNYYRIKCAAELLRMTDDYITDIAISCGFSDLSYFSKLFKRYIEMSASEYRKMYRERK